MSLSKQQKFKPGSKERRILDSFGSILPRDAESRIYQLKSNGVVITVTVIVEGIVGLMLYENQKGRFRIHETTSIANLLELFKPHERECFFNVICRLALVQTQGHILNHLELSNQLLQKGYGCLGDVNLFGLINERTEHQPLEYSDPAATKERRILDSFVSVSAYIPLYRNSELSDNGEIGCDYLMTDNQVKDEIKWRNMTTFDNSCDQQIGRELPFPSKKGTESAEITSSTAKANVKDGTTAQKNTNYPPTLPDTEGTGCDYLTEDIMATAVGHETNLTERPTQVEASVFILPQLTGPSLEYPMSTSLYDEVEWEVSKY